MVKMSSDKQDAMYEKIIETQLAIAKTQHKKMQKTKMKFKMGNNIILLFGFSVLIAIDSNQRQPLIFRRN